MKESQMLLFSIISNILAKKAFIMNANNSSWVKSKIIPFFSIKISWAQSYKICLTLFISALLTGCGNDNNSNDKAVLKTIVAGDYHSLALFDDGRVYAAGNNNHGQLGFGDNNNRTVFTEVVDLRDKNIVTVTAGGLHSFALSNEGKVYAVGLNLYGELGIGSNFDIFTEITYLDNIAIAATDSVNSFMLSNDGRVYASGLNEYGELGFGDNMPKDNFTEIIDLKDKNITAVAVGYFHSLALSKDGKIYATGDNYAGQLGLSDNNPRDTFTEITDLSNKNITAVVAGYSYSLALSNDGRVYAAGQNDYGQLGFGDNNPINTFTEVTDLKDKNITAVTAGYSHSLALSNDGRVYAAGQNDYGQLGLGDNVSQSNFTEVLIPIS
jgi:alpha-tubulin suppressor-like RCC1 family protein